MQKQCLEAVGSSNLAFSPSLASLSFFVCVIVYTQNIVYAEEKSTRKHKWCFHYTVWRWWAHTQTNAKGRRKPVGQINVTAHTLMLLPRRAGGRRNQYAWFLCLFYLFLPLIFFLPAVITSLDFFFSFCCIFNCFLSPYIIS